MTAWMKHARERKKGSSLNMCVCVCACVHAVPGHVIFCTRVKVLVSLSIFYFLYVLNMSVFMWSSISNVYPCLCPSLSELLTTCTIFLYFLKKKQTNQVISSVKCRRTFDIHYYYVWMFPYHQRQHLQSKWNIEVKNGVKFLFLNSTRHTYLSPSSPCLMMTSSQSAVS